MPADRVLALLASDAAVFLDLPLESTLPLAPLLTAHAAAVVPILLRWPKRGALLPAHRLIHLFVDIAPRLVARTADRGVVFLLDGERALPGARPPLGRRFDNRYAYSADRFPAPDLLRTRGIRTVCWLSHGAPTLDLHAYVLSQEASGLEVHSLHME